VEWQLQIVRKFYRSLMELVLSPTQHWIFKVKVKAKVKLSLCFNWASRHKGVLGERRYSSTHYLTSALDGGEWSSSHPGLFTPRARAPGTHWTRGWVGPRAGLDAVATRIPIITLPGTGPNRPSRSQVSILTELTSFLTIVVRFIFHVEINNGSKMK